MPIRHFFEYLALRFGLLVLRLLPLSAAQGLCSGLAGLWYRLNGARRRVAIENILRSGISNDEKEADRIASASFCHFAMLVAESIKSDQVVTEENWQDHVEMDVPDVTMAMLKDPKQGLILVSGHLGNWEMAAQLLSFLKPVVGITKKMSNPYTDRLIRERKPRHRFRLTPMRDANAGRFLSVLKGGEILALLVDQHAKGHRTMVEFFGTPASTHSSPALLHLVTKTPIIFGTCVQKGPLQYRLMASEPIVRKPSGSREADVRGILEDLNHHLETAIRKNPEQYLWAHRRWREKR